MINIAKKKNYERFAQTWDGRLSKIMRDFGFSFDDRQKFIDEQKSLLINANYNDDEKYRFAYKAFKPMLEEKLNIAHEIAKTKKHVKLKSQKLTVTF